MAYATDTATVGISFSQRFTEFCASVTERVEKARVYRTTATELQNMSNRELADLGITRDAIKGIAIQAAYGK
jgi:uncharacterized protein YjiS (DUF1127 family)